MGLVLSGGGARGFAHIGVLKVLEEQRVPIDVIAATSMGSIVGGAYAAGYSAGQLDRLVRATDWGEIFARRAPRADLNFRRKEDDFQNLSDVEFGFGVQGLSLPRGAVSTQNLGLFLRALGAPVKDVNDLALLPIPFAAMATDLATGKLVVLSQGVTLATAMRASMSVPGAFAPIEVSGQALVDGGLVRNLPVDVARALGAQVVIAVNVGTPLAPREKLTDVVAVTEQMINILTEQNVERSLAELGPRDILITPDLAGFGAGDFGRGEAIRRAGEAAARAVVDRLRALAVPEPDFAAYERARSNPVREDRALAISAVQIEGLRVVDRDAVRAELDIPPGRKLSAAELDRAVQRVFGRGDFEAVTYRLADEPLGRRLVVTPYEKSWGYNALRFGGSLVTGLGTPDSFNLLAAHTWSWLNAAGAEWRNELQIGEVRRAASEFYQPLGAGSRLFVLPRVWTRKEEFEVFVERRAVLTIEAKQRAVELQAGRDFRGLGTARLGAGQLRTDLAVRIGLPPLAAHDETLFWRAELRADTLDSLAFPRHGVFLLGHFVRYADRQGSTGRNNARSFDAVLPLTLGRNTATVTLRRVESGVDVGERLGGPFNLTGTTIGEVAGERGALARLLLARNVSDVFGELAMPVYAGVSFETGYARGGLFAGPSDVQRAVSLYLAADSPVGPVYVLAGRTFGAGSALYLLWGRPR